MDVDGVLTDGTLLIAQDGSLLRKMHVRDGYAIQYAIKKGLLLAIFTGGGSPAVKKRLQSLGIQHIYERLEDKATAFKQFCQTHHLSFEQTLYIGDDLLDLEVLQLAGVAVAPADADEAVQAIADWITKHNGGQGCVREVIQTVLQSQGLW